MQELRGEVVVIDQIIGLHCIRPTLLALMTVVTRCQILTLKCTKFDFGWDP